MRNFWLYSFFAVMYLVLSWAVDEAFARDIGYYKGQDARLEEYLKTKKKPILPIFKNVKVPIKKREKRQAQEESFLNTLSLSYAGDFAISDTISQGRELFGALTSTLGSMVNMRMVRSIVDSVVERLNGRYTIERQGRSDLPYDDDRSRSNVPRDDGQENIKKGITTLVGAALGEQECVQRSACLAGEYASQLPGKDVLFLVLDRFAPESWLSTISTFKQSATYIEDCQRYICTTESAQPKGK